MNFVQERGPKIGNRAATLLNWEYERLRAIGSTKDPVLFQTMRKFLQNDSTKNRTIIVNWAKEDGSHGCRFKCDFCSWKKKAEEIGNITPSMESLRSFLSPEVKPGVKVQGYKVTISGGGDPLFDLEKNLGRFTDLVESIHAAGYLVEVITKEVGLVKDLHRAELACVDYWSFSAETRQKNLAALIGEMKTPVRVSRVCTPGRNIGLADYARFFVDAGAYEVVLREDYYQPLSETGFEMNSVRKAILARPGYVTYLKTDVCSDNFFLVNDEVLTDMRF